MHVTLLAVLILASGPLPLPMPSLPVIPVFEPPEITLGEAEHSEEYAGQQAAIEDQINDWMAPIETWNSAFGEWLGPSGIMPDPSGGDFDTGLEPIDNIGSLYEFAAWLGEQIASLFSYLLAGYEVVSDFPSSIQILVIIIIANASFLLVCRISNWVVRLFDLGWTMLNTLIQTIMEIIPL